VLRSGQRQKLRNFVTEDESWKRLWHMVDCSPEMTCLDNPSKMSRRKSIWLRSFGLPTVSIPYLLFRKENSAIQYYLLIFVFPICKPIFVQAHDERCWNIGKALAHKPKRPREALGATSNMRVPHPVYDWAWRLAIFTSSVIWKRNSDHMPWRTETAWFLRSRKLSVTPRRTDSLRSARTGCSDFAESSRTEDIATRPDTIKTRIDSILVKFGPTVYLFIVLIQHNRKYRKFHNMCQNISFRPRSISHFRKIGAFHPMSGRWFCVIFGPGPDRRQSIFPDFPWRKSSLSFVLIWFVPV
jgi:hypothetical protein